MSKEKIEAFKKIVNGIKINYDVTKSAKLCNLCDQTLGGSNKCPCMAGEDEAWPTKVTSGGGQQQSQHSQGPGQYKQQGAQGRGWVQGEARGQYSQPQGRRGGWGQQTETNQPWRGQFQDNRRNPQQQQQQGYNQRNYPDNRRRQQDTQNEHIRYSKSAPPRVFQQRNYEERAEQPPEKSKGVNIEVLKKSQQSIKEKTDNIPQTSQKIKEIDKVDKEMILTKAKFSTKKSSVLKVQPNITADAKVKVRRPLSVHTPPPGMLQNNIARKRKSDLSVTASVSSDIKRRKKAEEVVKTFAEIIEGLNSAIENMEDNEDTILTATTSINDNMEDFTNSLHRSRSTLHINLDKEVDDVKSLVYKELSDELQSLYELSMNLKGKWRKKVIEMGTENVNAMFTEKRQHFPNDFLSTFDDEIENAITKLKVSEGKPKDILPLLKLVNEIEYSLKFLGFVQGIKAQGHLSLQPERIQDVIKEYIIEDLNERTKKETKKLNLLSQALSKIESKKHTETITAAINTVVSNMSHMAKQAENFFIEVTEIVKINSTTSKNKLFNKDSPEAAWKRAFIKYSPTNATTLSPVKQCEANLLPTMSEDSVFLALAWVLEMSEQFYYDNALILTNHKKKDPKLMCRILKLNFQTFDKEMIKDDFTDVVTLGSGSFGDVYRVTKKGSNDHFAIKYMKKFPPGLFRAHFKMIVSFLHERNYIISAKNSPYIVKFIQSFRIPSVNGYFLIFEWCLSDLRQFMELIDFKDPRAVSVSLWESERNGITKIFKKAKDKNDIDLEPTVIVYIFEIFCGLDFLAKSNVVHQDLKPENIMISNSLHLKIGDFGLVFNTKFITKPHQSYLINFADLDYFVNEPFQQTFGGTELYNDMELSFTMLTHYYPDDAKELIYHSDAFDYDISSKSSDPNFLSDLWSAGIIILELLLGATLFLHDTSIESYVQRGMQVSGNYKKILLQITYLKTNYKRYIYEGLIAFGGEKYKEMMVFLSSIFKPRELRAVEFVKEKEIYFYNKKVVEKCVDISKIERLNVFSQLKLHSHNSFLFEMPMKISELLTKRYKVQHRTFRDLLKSTIDESVVLDLKPGTDIQV